MIKSRFNVGDAVIAWWPEGDDAYQDFKCTVVEVNPVFHNRQSYEYKLKSGDKIYNGIEGFIRADDTNRDTILFK